MASYLPRLSNPTPLPSADRHHYVRVIEMANIEHDNNDQAHDAGESALEAGEGEGNVTNPTNPLNGNESNPGDAHLRGDGEEPVRKPSIFKRIWTKLDLDVPTVMMMFKLISPLALCS